MNERQPIISKALKPANTPDAAKKGDYGMQVRTGLHAGAWQCTSCQGQVMGDQLFQPKCSYCQAV